MKSIKQKPGSTLYAAQTRRTIAAAERDEVRNRVIKGELVKREAVEKEWFQISRQVRDNLQNIADRIADEVTAELDRDKNHATINREIYQALQGLAGLSP